MKEFFITGNDEGQRLDKYLKRILPSAGSSFLYKMLRKKNIVLNEKKAEGKEILKKDDVIQIFFSEETFLKFSQSPMIGDQSSFYSENQKSDEKPMKGNAWIQEYINAYHQLKNISVLYEDEHLLLLVKPKGVLSQKAKEKDASLNEWMLGYLLEKKEKCRKDFSYFKPSVLNRLDRNTSGIVMVGKSLVASREISKMLQEQKIKKYYLTTVEGILTGEDTLIGYHDKNEEKNLAKIYQKPVIEGKEYKQIITKYRVLSQNKNTSTLEVELVTGKSHQIRAHLASIHHPIVGDIKYGSNMQLKDGYFLHCYKIVFPVITGTLAALSEKVFETND